MLSKLGGNWAPRPSTGPHKLRECLPLSLILRNRLKYSLTRRETIMIVARRLVKVDGKVRSELNYPAGFMDVISIAKTNENFRLLYDVKGRFRLVQLKPEEAQYKLCRVVKTAVGAKASIGTNPFFNGQKAAIPYLTTHDGRTIRFADPSIKANDSIKLNLSTGKVEAAYKFEVGALVMITKGANIGRVGVVAAVERHPGSFDVVHIRDRRNNTFATRLSNVFVIGDQNKVAVTLPRGNGVKRTILEEQESRLKKQK